MLFVCSPPYHLLARISSNLHLQNRTTVSVSEIMEALVYGNLLGWLSKLSADQISAHISHSYGFALISHYCKHGNRETRRKGQKKLSPPSLYLFCYVDDVCDIMKSKHIQRPSSIFEYQVRFHQVYKRRI